MKMRRRVPWFIHFHLLPFRFISNILCGLFGWLNHWYCQKLSWTKIAGWVKYRRKTRLKWGSLLRYMDIWIAPLFTPVYILHNMHMRIKNCQPHFFIEEYTAVPPQVLNSIVSLECVPLHSQKMDVRNMGHAGYWKNHFSLPTIWPNSICTHKCCARYTRLSWRM